jgi:hypothetical protein
MSRSGYSEDLDTWALIRWRGAVLRASRGKRGQEFFRDLVAALDAMPEKRLVSEALVRADGEVCALGALGLRRGMDLDQLDPEDRERVAAAFNIAPALAAEVVYENDEAWSYNEAPAARWTRMRAWAVAQLEATS